MHIGGRCPESACAITEVLAARGGVQGDPPRVLDAGEELLREGERACHAVVCGREVRPHAFDGPDSLRDVGRTGIGESGLQLDVGVQTGVQLAEHLADDRHRTVVRAVDD